MKTYLLLLILITSYTAKCQKEDDRIISGVCSIMQGLCEGIKDASLYHIRGSNQWWNGKNSWTNKYKNHDPNQGAAFFGSTTVFVSVTDAPHFFNMVSHQFNSFAIAFAPGRVKGEKFIKTAWRAIKANMVRQAGYSLMFEFILKPKK